MLHQAKVEGELLERQALEQRQHPVPAVGAHEVVGVLDARADAFERRQFTDVQTLEP